MTDARGRPLRSLLILLLCWTAGRIAVATPWSGLPPAMAHEMKPRTVFAIGPAPFHGPATSLPLAAIRLADRDIGRGRARLTVPIVDAGAAPVRLAGAAAPPEREETPSTTPFAAPLLPKAPATSGRAASRWSLDSWLLWREGGSGDSLPEAGRLGASQAGARLLYDLTPSAPSRLSAYARLTAALQKPAAPEAGLGLAYQPSRAVPFSVALERRVALGRGARDAFALVAATGIGPVTLAPDLWSEGYTQFGLVGLRRRDGFIDGKISLLHALGGESASAGLSLSGGAQPHLGRLDIGPEIRVRLPTGGIPARLGAEWRQRIAGRASPGSGLAVTMVAGF